MKAIYFPFRLITGGKLAITSNYNEIVRGQVIDALMTNQGERVFRPRYGCDVQSALFDPTNELVRHDAAGMLKQRLEELVPRAFIRSVTMEVGGTAGDVFVGGQVGAVYVTVMYRASMYATDTTVTVPVSSEFVNRQYLALESGDDLS